MADANAEEPQVQRRVKLYQVPTLRELCGNALVKYRQYLGDVGYMDVESLRTICWNCTPQQLERIEDETLEGSDRNLEWYTWHLWKRHLASEFGGAVDGQVEPLQSPEPVDYTPPRGVEAEPGDYRTLYHERKEEMAGRVEAAKRRIADANLQVQEQKDSRKAKMIDQMQPGRRQRSSGGPSVPRTAASTASAYMHKPRPNSRSSLMSNPKEHLKLLKELGLAKPGANASKASSTTVRIIRPPPVSAAAAGHSSNAAGAKLLSRATGGQLGNPARGAPPQGAWGQPAGGSSRAAAVAAAAAERAQDAARSAAPKRPAAQPAGHQAASKAARVGDGGHATGGGAAGSRPDPRVMFPRQTPPAVPGQSKLAVPAVTSGFRASPVSPPVGGQARFQQRSGGRVEGRAVPAVAGGGKRTLFHPSDDL